MSARSRRPALPGGPYVVAGLARSGVAAALALYARGERVTGVDSGEPDIGALAGKVEVHVATEGAELLAGARTLVKSPGIAAEAAIVRAARERRMTVIGELELAWRLLENDFVAVTGTNGKTTTVELLGEIHRAAAIPVAVAGNVGTALSTLVCDGLDPAAVVVCEASSFQLEDAVSFAPEAAVLLNLAPDHLDRHQTLSAYRAAKLAAFARQSADAIAVLPDDFDQTDLPGDAARVRFGRSPGCELIERDGRLWWRGDELIAVEEIRLRGEHNRCNAMAAAAVALARGIDAGSVRQCLREFAGVAHRLEPLPARRGVTFINDSKATNVASTLVALRSFPPRSVHLILGGQGKDQDFAPLRTAVERACRAVYLIGADRAAIAAALAGLAASPHDCVTLERAVSDAASAALEGEVVLLSPACASFDQFDDFEQRGACFKALVAALE